MAFRAHIQILNVSLNLCVAVYQLWCLILHHQKALPWISLKTTESAGWPTTVEGLLASAPESDLQVAISSTHQRETTQ